MTVSDIEISPDSREHLQQKIADMAKELYPKKELAVTGWRQRPVNEMENVLKGLFTDPALLLDRRFRAGAYLLRGSRDVIRKVVQFIQMACHQDSYSTPEYLRQLVCAAGLLTKVVYDTAYKKYVGHRWCKSVVKIAANDIGSLKVALKALPVADMRVLCTHLGVESGSGKLRDLLDYNPEDTAYAETNYQAGHECLTREQIQRGQYRDIAAIIESLTQDFSPEGTDVDELAARAIQCDLPYSPTNLQGYASSAVSLVMSLIGYGQPMRRIRIQHYLAMGASNEKQNQQPCTKIIVGSRADGLTSYIESDIDALYVFHGVTCLEVGVVLKLHRAGAQALFRMDTRAYPGHCRLVLWGLHHTLHPQLYSALCRDEFGRAVLSSDLLLKEIQHGNVDLVRAGPSLASTHGLVSSDTVYCIQCFCPNILRRWAQRERFWPSRDIVNKVAGTIAFLTPVGFKGSETKDIEWRICFNTGEMQLVLNLNDTQFKLYAILKMIVKEVLVPRNKEVTSFMIKNIVFWLAEKNPQILFQEKSLFYWLQRALGELRIALNRSELPYYMIPERNLMAANGMVDVIQQKWVETITEMIEEGPKMVLRLKKIRGAIISSPKSLLWYSTVRAELEVLTYYSGFLSVEVFCRKQDSEPYVEKIKDIKGMVVNEIRRRLKEEGIRVDDHDLIKLWKCMLK